MLSILIAGSYAVERRGLRALLETQADWKIVAEASNGREAAEQAAKLRPNICILDISMPQLNGFEAARLILKAVPNSRVLLLTAHHSEEILERALKVGVQGYVLKSDAEADLVKAVRALRASRTFFTATASEVLKNRLSHRPQETKQAPLTIREAQVIQLLAEGKSNKEVAHMLGISPRTVENHRAQIMHRLGLHSFSELVRFAIRNGIIEP